MPLLAVDIGMRDVDAYAVIPSFVMIRVATALVVLIAAPAGAQTATDGDTIKVDRTTWRLGRIGAPELHQTCRDSWPAGAEAKALLERLMAGGTVHCEDRGKDRYGRSIGLCRAGGKDL